MKQTHSPLSPNKMQQRHNGEIGLWINRSTTYWGVNTDHYCPYCASCCVDFLQSVLLRIPAHSSPSPTQLCKAALHGGPARGGRQKQGFSQWQQWSISSSNTIMTKHLSCSASVLQYFHSKMLLSGNTTERGEKMVVLLNTPWLFFFY